MSVTRRSSGGGGGGGGGGGSTTYTVSTDAGRNGDVTVSPSRASYGDTVTITVEPDEGYELDELIVTDSDGDEISIRSRGDGRYTFIMPRSRVTVEATFVEITEDPDLLTFTDVPASAYYYDAVYWAVENGVTNGTSATTFSPDASCTRAQMVTFLWRAAGSPEPESTVNPFTDVSASAYYYDAVLWAVEQGITNGTSATTFGPDATVTRGQTVTSSGAMTAPPPSAQRLCGCGVRRLLRRRRGLGCQRGHHQRHQRHHLQPEQRLHPRADRDFPLSLHGITAYSQAAAGRHCRPALFYIRTRPLLFRRWMPHDFSAKNIEK